MDRNPAKNGGEDTLYVRQRKVFAPLEFLSQKQIWLQILQQMQN